MKEVADADHNARSIMMGLEDEPAGQAVALRFLVRVHINKRLGHRGSCRQHVVGGRPHTDCRQRSGSARSLEAETEGEIRPWIQSSHLQRPVCDVDLRRWTACSRRPCATYR